MANTLEHKVLYTPHGEKQQRELSFASAKNAVGFAVPYVKDRLWTNVSFMQLSDDGQWIPDRDSESTLMAKTGSAKKETSMSAVPSLIQLEQLLSVLEKQAMKSKLTPEQLTELLNDAMNALVAVGITKEFVVAAVDKAYPRTLVNDATEKVAVVTPLPQAVPPTSSMHVTVPTKPIEEKALQKEQEKQGFFGRKN